METWPRCMNAPRRYLQGIILLLQAASNYIQNPQNNGTHKKQDDIT